MAMKNLFARILPFLCMVLLVSLLLTGCPLCRFLSVSCPGCGLTRAWFSFFRGDFRQAFRYNPFFLPAPLFVVLYAFMDYFPPKYARPISIVLFVFAISMAVYHTFIR